MKESQFALSELKAVRILFPRGKNGEALCRTALQTRTPSELLRLRADFGQGVSGQERSILSQMEPLAMPKTKADISVREQPHLQ